MIYTTVCTSFFPRQNHIIRPYKKSSQTSIPWSMRGKYGHIPMIHAPCSSEKMTLFFFLSKGRGGGAFIFNHVQPRGMFWKTLPSEMWQHSVWLKYDILKKSAASILCSEDEGSTLLHNISKFLPDYSAYTRKDSVE